MGCFFPHTAYYGEAVNPVTGRRPLVFDKRKAWTGVAIPVPCGKCIGCRKMRARQWATRCMQEKLMHAESAFLTLTYSDENVPANMSLRKRDLQLFMKRLRKVRPQGLRFFGCGEYGGQTARPHYHVLLLNTCFPDMKFYKESAGSGNKLFVSAELDGLWSNGNCDIGEVTFQSCVYTASYLTKSVSKVTDGREPEFLVMSRRPGIGRPYYEKYGADAFRHDSVVVNGFEQTVPIYYDNLEVAAETIKVAVSGSLYSAGMEAIKRERRRKAMLVPMIERSHARRKVREEFEIKKARTFAKKGV